MFLLWGRHCWGDVKVRFLQYLVQDLWIIGGVAPF